MNGNAVTKATMIDSIHWPESEGRKSENRDLKASFRYIEDYVQRLLSRRERSSGGDGKSKFTKNLGYFN